MEHFSLTGYIFFTRIFNDISFYFSLNMLYFLLVNKIFFILFIIYIWCILFYKYIIFNDTLNPYKITNRLIIILKRSLNAIPFLLI